MNNSIKISVLLLCLSFGFTIRGQVTIENQIQEIPSSVSRYLDSYLNDLTSGQGISYLNSMNNSARVLDQWKLNFSLNFGAGFGSSQVQTYYCKNMKVIGEAPSVFGNESPGCLYYCFIDEITGAPIRHPFTGEDVGFEIPLFQGLGTGMGISPALQPVISMGIGYGTEISFGILPGVIKGATSNLSEDFSLTKDMMFSVGLGHDVFHWIPALNDRNYHLRLGLSYTNFVLGTDVSPDIIGTMSPTSGDLVFVENNLSGFAYGFSAIGIEIMATKSFNFIDLSLFGSYNQSNYTLSSQGNLELNVAKSFYQGEAGGYDLYTIDNLINVENTINRFMFGASARFNLGRFNLGLKYGYAEGSYAAGSLGIRIIK